MSRAGCGRHQNHWPGASWDISYITHITTCRSWIRFLPLLQCRTEGEHCLLGANRPFWMKASNRWILSMKMMKKTWKLRLLWSESDTSTENRRLFFSWSLLDASDANAQSLGQELANHLGPRKWQVQRYSNYVSLCETSVKRVQEAFRNQCWSHAKIQINLIDLYELISDSRGRSVCSYVPFRPAKAGGAHGHVQKKRKKTGSKSFANWFFAFTVIVK